MFIILLTYISSLNEVDKALDEHVLWLKKEYKKGSFIVSGKRKPRIGGVLLSKIKEKNKLEEILQQDPFYQKKLIKYEIIEFTPTMSKSCFENLLD